MKPAVYKGIKLYPLLEDPRDLSKAPCSQCKLSPISSSNCMRFQNKVIQTSCAERDVTYYWQAGAKAEVQYILERIKA